MRKRKGAVYVALVLVIACCFGLSSCQKDANETFDPSEYRKVAELATLECYYHNVVEMKNDGKDYLFGLINIGYKKAWFEYRGKVRMWVDVEKVEIAEPTSSGTVVVPIPSAQILGIPDVDESSFSDVWCDKGFMTEEFSLADKTAAHQEAQSKMKEEMNSDQELLGQAQERARVLLEQYVMNLADARGETWKVEFVEADVLRCRCLGGLVFCEYGWRTGEID